MSIRPQVILVDGQPAFAVISWAEWMQVRPLVERAARAGQPEARLPARPENVPATVLQAVQAGRHPVAAVRTYRGLSQAQLAKRAGISRLYLSQIETRRRGGSRKLYRTLADALDVPLALLEDAPVLAGAER